jgi:hypothetical protein
MNMREPMMTNGAAYLRSCAWRPGAMNAHTCHRMAGEDMKSAVISATFICTQNASVGAVNTSLWPSFVMGRARKSVMRSLKGKAITRPARTP